MKTRGCLPGLIVLALLLAVLAFLMVVASQGEREPHRIHETK